MSTQSAGAPSGPRWTLDAKTGFIVACSVLLAVTVVVGRGVAPVAAMLILLSALLAWHRSILAWPVVICLFNEFLGDPEVINRKGRQQEQRLRQR